MILYVSTLFCLFIQRVERGRDRREGKRVGLLYILFVRKEEGPMFYLLLFLKLKDSLIY